MTMVTLTLSTADWLPVTDSNAFNLTLAISTSLANDTLSPSVEVITSDLTAVYYDKPNVVFKAGETVDVELRGYEQVEINAFAARYDCNRTCNLTQYQLGPPG